MQPNLNELLNDYNTNFSNKSVEMTTNYKKISMIKIKMEENNFPHLLGLHYCIHGKSATELCKMIKLEQLEYEQIRKTQEFKFYNIKERIGCYSYLGQFLYNAEGRVFYPTDNLKPNPMKLTLVFSERKGNGEVVLGVKRDIEQDCYRLATLHYSRKQKYTNMRSSKILATRWY
ncbi:PBECR4 domain-containing protein [Enterococcus sp. DIV0876]|uniref:PBECR4 domain-containing protein n=1 Tax=Enterococcus sp. DIV0876 TaxID=2774633 RepID=UPI003D2FA167